MLNSHRRRSETGTGSSLHRTPYKPASSRTLFAGGAIALGFALAGCSGLPPALDLNATGSIAPKAIGYASEPVPKGITLEDWAAARTALTEALGENEASPSVPWENLSSATRGTVTPLGETRPGKAGKCREFLMSFVRETNEEWLQGEACPLAKGAQWKVEQARVLERG